MSPQITIATFHAIDCAIYITFVYYIEAFVI